MAKKPAPKSAAAKSSPSPAAKADGKGAPSSAKKAATKAELYTALSEKTGLSRKEVAGVFDGLAEIVGRELGKKGPGQFTVPGLLKIKVVRKPATKARPGKNPFTGEAITIAAKPARNVVRAIPMKALKEMV
jgi:nucleoid DNA-binding protein